MRNKLLFAIVGSLFIANQASAAVIKIWLRSPYYEIACVITVIVVIIIGFNKMTR